MKIDTLTGGRFVVHERPEATLGTRLMWEQSYWLERMNIAQPCAFRKDQARQLMLPRLAALCGLGFSAFSHGMPVSGGVRDVCLASSLLLAWMIQRWYWRHRQGISVHELETSIRSFFSLAAVGLQAIRSPFNLEVFHRGRRFLLHIDVQSFTVEQWDAMLGADMALQRSWNSFLMNPCQLHALRLGTGTDVSTAFLWCCHEMAPGYWKLNSMASPLIGPHNFLLRVLAVGFETYVLVVHQDGPPLALKPDPLFGRKRRLRIDPEEIVQAIKRHRVTGGSSNTSMWAHTGIKDLDRRVGIAECTLGFEKSKRMMKGSQCVSVQWDPGTYKGRHWNIGLMAKIDMDDFDDKYACDLVPKVFIHMIPGICHRFGSLTFFFLKKNNNNQKPL